MSSVTSLGTKFLEQVAAAATLEDLEKVRIDAFGKHGQISLLMKTLGQLQGEERKVQGEALNSLRTRVTAALEAKRKSFEQGLLLQNLAREKIDVTLPPRPAISGTIHPLSQAQHEITQILTGMGFLVTEGPEIDSDQHNFTDLNIPESHPARQAADTFYLPAEGGSKRVLRTHTSPVQIRTMKIKHPPLRIIAPGRVFRSDYDQTHTPNFHQVEGLYIASGIHMGHLKSCLQEFLQAFFGIPNLVIRFRPSYFPFTEPSAEVDIACSRRGGELKIGGTGDWLEVLGCGMVHSKVLENCGIDPTQFQGFAFGMGIERLAMLKYGIADLRAFYETGLGWLRHHGFHFARALNAQAAGAPAIFERAGL